MPNRKSVKSYDSSYDEGIYSWNRDEAMIRPERLSCPKCNHNLSELDCGGMRCAGCGYSVSIYDKDCKLNKGYDNITDDADYIDSPEYNFHRYNKSPDKLPKHNKSKRVRFANHNDYIPDYSEIEHMENESKPDTTNTNTATATATAEKPLEPEKEIDKGYRSYVIAFFISFIIFMMLVAYCVAYSRGELIKEDGVHINWSIIVCIFFFHQMYLGYALVDWTTRPNHGCKHY